MVDQLVGFSLCCLVNLVEFLKNLNNSSKFVKQRQTLNFFKILSNKINLIYFTYQSKIVPKSILIERFQDNVIIITEN